ncbi:SdiA-regulated domain-containing protein [Vulcanococcus limneticus]|uniref:SdiA-regulated domain-containing protein n=1 Tax=Vulcanococcus limneticus TaxID=2170428 RepID=UPI00398C081D
MINPSHAGLTEKITTSHRPLKGMALAFALGCGLMAVIAWFPRRLWSYWTFEAASGAGSTGYVVLQEGLALQGIRRNISGLTYSAATNTLFAVLNGPRRVVEISPCGRVLRILPTTFGDDLEAISHVSGDLFVIASEKGNVIWGTRLNSTTQQVKPLSSHTLAISFNRSKNEGIEGLSWDHRGNRLFLANEKNPLQIVEVSGFDRLMLAQPTSLSFSIWNPSQSLADLAGDVSSISFNESWNAMAFLSDESRRVYRFDDKDHPSLLLRLQRGHHGLESDVAQPEGLAFGPDDSIYVVAEPNRFYRFAPSKAGIDRAHVCAKP